MQEQRPHRDDAVQREYARLAKRYDRRWRFYVDATVRETLRRLATEGVRAILDIGCGTGALLQELSHRLPDAKLAGVDVTPDMLTRARAKLGNRAVLEVAGAERLPFPDAMFDAIVSTSAFHYIRSPQQALREMDRVLRPGGQIVITDWCDDYWSCRVCDMVLRLFNRAHFRAYNRQQCEALLQLSPLEQVEVERYKINWMWGMMTATARKADDPRA